MAKKAKKSRGTTPGAESEAIPTLNEGATALEGNGACPIQPEPPSDREISGGVSDGQLGAAIRQLTTQGRVTVLWTCNQRLWLRSIRTDAPSTLRVG